MSGLFRGLGRFLGRNANNLDEATEMGGGLARKFAGRPPLRSGDAVLTEVLPNSGLRMNYRGDGAEILADLDLPRSGVGETNINAIGAPGLTGRGGVDIDFGRGRQVTEVVDDDGLPWGKIARDSSLASGAGLGAIFGTTYVMSEGQKDRQAGDVYGPPEPTPKQKMDQSIPKLEGLTPGEQRLVNKVTATRLTPNEQRLADEQGSTGASSVFALKAPIVIGPDDRRQERTYRIKDGANLSHITGGDQNAIDAIVKANNIANPDLIYAGDRLVIPRGVSIPQQSLNRYLANM
jgi:hypothetical protein